MKPVCFLLLLVLGSVGCRTSTIESRREERYAAYSSFSPEIRQLIDQGQIRRGMPMDAVYIAWGPPQEVLEQETSRGHEVLWHYHGTYLQETRYWNYREVARDGTIYLDRYLDHAYDPRDYVRAEIIFQDGKVVSWRTLPRPPG